jgi:hypothetical protein
MDQRWADLYAAVARQAVHDLHSGYTHPRHMDAARCWKRPACSTRRSGAYHDGYTEQMF